MRKRTILSVICTMAMLIMAGCAGNESGTDSQQVNNSAPSAETTTEQVSENTQETEVSEAADLCVLRGCLFPGAQGTGDDLPLCGRHRDRHPGRLPL